MEVCCFNKIKAEPKPKPFDHRNIYQQFKFYSQHRDTFFSKSLAADGIPPKCLRNKGWELRVSRFFRANLADALGLDARLRARLPSFNFPIQSRRSASIVVGQWYCPFIFVREEARLRKQMKRSMFYHMTLEQWWQEFYSCEKVAVDDDEGNVVNVTAIVRREVNLMVGLEALKERKIGPGGFLWYRGRSGDGRKRGSVGLSVAIVEKMRWLQEEGGWFDGREKEVRVERVEEIKSENGWRRFACYMLVESFALRRLNGTLVLRSDFRHTQRIRSKWE